MHTPAPVDRLLEVVQVLGRPTAILLFNSGWMRRRKDTVELLSDTWARQKSSVDVAIPMSLNAITLARDGFPPQFAVPVFLLPKVPPTLMHFHFRSGDDRLTLPTRRQNGLVSYAALLWAARQVLDWPLPVQIREQLLFVAVGPSEYAAPVSWRMRAPQQGSPKLPALEKMPALWEAEDELQRWCAQMQAMTPVALPDLPEDGPPDASALLTLNQRLSEDARSPVGHQTISLTYDVSLYKEKAFVGAGFVARQGWLPYEVVFQTPFVGARSYHFEFVAPPGVEATRSRLLVQPLEDEWDPQEPVSPPAPAPGLDEDDDEAGRPEYDHVANRGELVHLYWSEGDPPDAISAQLFLRVSPERFVGAAALAAAAVAGTLAACAVLTRPLVSHATGAQTLLLLIPGVLATLIARAGDHALTMRMLQGARRTLLYSGALAFVGAGFLALIHTGNGAHAFWWHRWVFIGLTVVAAWQAAKLWLARLLAEDSRPQGWLERQVDESARARGAPGTPPGDLAAAGAEAAS